MPDEKRIDEAWKNRVRQEKTQAEEDGGPAPEPSEEPQPQEAASDRERRKALFEKLDTPEAKFTVLVSSLVTQALVSLGEVEHPISKQKEVDLESARFSIDLLQVLSEKTRGNLTDLEKRYLEGVLYDLRMRFVEASE
jgi:hypothetical protein